MAATFFQDWQEALRDMTARGAVLRRINWLKAGNLGGHKACREGLMELWCDGGRRQEQPAARYCAPLACKEDFLRRVALEMEDMAHE